MDRTQTSGWPDAAATNGRRPGSHDVKVIRERAGDLVIRVVDNPGWARRSALRGVAGRFGFAFALIILVIAVVRLWPV